MTSNRTLDGDQLVERVALFDRWDKGDLTREEYEAARQEIWERHRGVQRDLMQIGKDIAAAKNVVVLTGAGMSTESGLPDYRGNDGLWKNRRFEELAHLDTFKREPAEFWDFYRERILSLDGAEPNKGHEILHQMVATGLVQTIITQNVDGLHKTWPDPVIELHGTLKIATCLGCGTDYSLDEVKARWDDQTDGVPRCECDLPLKPGVTLFGEALPLYASHLANKYARGADYMLVLGSSLQVTPASLLPVSVLLNGGKLGIINRGETGYDTEPGVTKVEATISLALREVFAEALCHRS